MRVAKQDVAVHEYRRPEALVCSYMAQCADQPIQDWGRKNNLGDLVREATFPPSQVSLLACGFWVVGFPCTTALYQKIVPNVLVPSRPEDHAVDPGIKPTEAVAEGL